MKTSPEGTLAETLEMPAPRIAGAFTKEERESPQTTRTGMPDSIIRSIGSRSGKFLD
jgi:hypothetical protein